MNTDTDAALEAIIERWGKAGLKVRLGGDGIELRVNPGTYLLHAVKMREADYLLYCASGTPSCRALMESLTGLKLPDGFVYVLFKCGDFERLYPTPAATIQNGGEAIVIPVGDGRPDYELQTGPDLPDVATITEGQKAAIMQDLASVFDPANLKAATEPKPAKESKAKEEKKAEEFPPGVPTTEWAKWTTPIKGFTWHAKLWKHMNFFTRVYVLMVQFAVLDMVMKGKSWDGVYRCYASRKHLADLSDCDQSTVYRIWLKLEEAGAVERVPGTGRKGVTSGWILHGLGFPERQAKK